MGQNNLNICGRKKRTPESQTSEPGIKAACHATRQLDPLSPRKEKPESVRDCVLFIGHENSPSIQKPFSPYGDLATDLSISKQNSRKYTSHTTQKSLSNFFEPIFEPSATLANETFEAIHSQAIQELVLSSFPARSEAVPGLPWSSLLDYTIGRWKKPPGFPID